MDLGTRRIGLAVSDGLGITAQGMETLVRRNLHADLEELARIAGEHDVDRILLGDPRRMNGEARPAIGMGARVRPRVWRSGCGCR